MMRDAQELGLLVELETRALEASTAQLLRFTIVNETHALAPYRQAALFENRGTNWTLTAASGLASVAKDSPFAVWLERFARTFGLLTAPRRLTFADADEQTASGWAEWLPEHLLLVPLRGPDGQTLALAMYAREAPWSDTEVTLLQRLHLSYGLCLASRGVSRRRSRWARALWSGKTALAVSLAVLAALVFVPVRLSVLAPAEVTALSAMVITAPQDGVVSVVAVAPNARVKAGDLLFSLDDSSLINRRQVALKSLDVARADAHVARQRAFDDAKSKAELSVAQGRVREKEAELASIDTLAQRVEVRAVRDGVAVFGDVNDWLGKPLQTGQRVMQLAEPEDAGVLVWLGVADAINLELDAPVRLFLHTDPLAPRAARLIETSYHAGLSPDGVAAYRIKARFDDGQTLPRVGLRGTARMSGDPVPLGYYLLRRPIAAVREWTGL